MKFLHQKRIQAFTLLETLVSIAILSFVIIGPLAVIMNSSVYARKTKDTMIATYLAEESTELLQNQYDSLYVFCQGDPGSCLLPDSYPNESPSQATWRIFKERLSATSSQPSCYLADNSAGCSFDFLNMIGDITTVPERYVATDTSCSSLQDVSSMVTQDGSQVAKHMYVCKGVPAHIPPGASFGLKEYHRSITVERIPATFESSLPPEQQYYDDLRIVTRVTFKSIYGATSSVSVTRFMHARQ